MTVISFLAYMGLEPEVAFRARQSKSRIRYNKLRKFRKEKRET